MDIFKKNCVAPWILKDDLEIKFLTIIDMEVLKSNYGGLEIELLGSFKILGFYFIELWWLWNILLHAEGKLFMDILQSRYWASHFILSDKKEKEESLTKIYFFLNPLLKFFKQTFIK